MIKVVVSPPSGHPMTNTYRSTTTDLTRRAPHLAITSHVTINNTPPRGPTWEYHLPGIVAPLTATSLTLLPRVPRPTDYPGKRGREIETARENSVNEIAAVAYGADHHHFPRTP